MPPFYPFYIIASRKGRASSAILGHCKKFRIRKAILNALWFWEISLSSLLSALNREPSCKSPTHSSYSHATSDSCSMMLMMSVSSFHQNHDWPDATRDSTRDQSSLILTFWPLRSTHKDCVLFLTDLFFFFFLCDTCYVLDNIYFCAFTYWTCKRLLWPISRHLQGTRRRPMDSRIGRQRGPSPARRVGAGPQAMQGMEECQSYLAFTFSQNHSVARWLHFCEIEFPQLRSIELGVPTPTFFFDLCNSLSLFSPSSQLSDRPPRISCQSINASLQWPDASMPMDRRSSPRYKVNLYTKPNHTLFFLLFYTSTQQ